MNENAISGHERGFVMLYVLIASTVIFALLGMAIQANHALHETNCRHLRELSKRAANITIHRNAD